MKKVILMFAVAITATAAQAEIYTYKCDQVRTTAEEAVATKPLKSFTLRAGEGRMSSNSRSRIVEMDADRRLLDKGAPVMHDTYGGYVKTANGDIFRCQRKI